MYIFNGLQSFSARRIIVLAVIFPLLYAFVWQACAEIPAAGVVQDVWYPLAERLIKDGEDPDFVTTVFSSSSVRFNPKVMPRKVTHNEYRLDYKKFLKSDRLNRAKRYFMENRELFQRVEKEFGVPGELEVAILLVETSLLRRDRPD